MQISKSHSKLYTALLLLVAFIWGFGFIATVRAMDAGYSESFIMMVRFSVTAVIFGFLAIKSLKSTTKVEVFGGIVTGTFLFAGFMLQIVGLTMTTPSNNALLTSCSVIFIPLFIWGIFKQKPSKKIAIGGIICFVGIAILSVDPKQIGALGLGDFLTFLCAISFALHNVFTSYFNIRTRVEVLNFYQMLTAAFWGILSFFLTDGNLEQFKPKLGMVWVGYLTILSTIFAYFILIRALKHIAPAKVGIITSAESVIASAFSVILGYEGLTNKLLVGGTLVFLAVIIVEKPQKTMKGGLKI